MLTDLVVTEKICPDEELMQIEREFVSSLAKIGHYSAPETGKLILTGDGVELHLSWPPR
jgi:heat shock protein HslJ